MITFYKKISLAIILLSLSISPLTAQDFYSPNEGSLLGLKQAKDLSVSISISGKAIAEKDYSVQFGYSPFDRIGLQASYSTLMLNYKRGRWSKISIANAAIGFYLFTPTQKTKNQQVDSFKKGFLADFYLGIAKGTVDISYTIEAVADLNFTKTFVQAGGHWKGALSQVGFTLKGGFLDYETGDVLGFTNELLNDVRDLEMNDAYPFFEGSFRLGIGPKQFKGFFTKSWMWTSSKDDINIITKNLQFGVLIELNQFFAGKA